MTIFQSLILEAKNYAAEHELSLVEFGVGISMIYAIIEGNGKKAIGTTLIPHQEGELFPIKGENINNIFEQAKEFNPLQRALALALVNAIGQYSLEDEIEYKENTQQLLPQKILDMTKVGDEVVFVGNLRPVVEKLKDNGRKPIVFCRQKNHYSQTVFSDIFEYEKIQESKIAIITGATLIGSTIDALMKLSPKDSIRIIAGFSCGANPKWFKNTGLTHVSSMKLDLDYKESINSHNWEQVFKYPGYFSSI